MYNVGIIISGGPPFGTAPTDTDRAIHHYSWRPYRSLATSH